mgnify:CR=1 FL=1
MLLALLLSGFFAPPAFAFDVVFESAGKRVDWHGDYESLGPIFDYFFGSDLGRRALRITLLTYLDAFELFRLRLLARRFRDELPNRVANLTFIPGTASRSRTSTSRAFSTATDVIVDYSDLVVLNFSGCGKRLYG